MSLSQVTQKDQPESPADTDTDTDTDSDTDTDPDTDTDTDTDADTELPEDIIDGLITPSEPSYGTNAGGTEVLIFAVLLPLTLWLALVESLRRSSSTTAR